MIERGHGKSSDRIIVRFRDDVPESAIRVALREQGLVIVRKLGHTRQLVVRAGSAGAAGAAIDRLRTSPLVLRADSDRLIRARRKALPADPYFLNQWYLHNTGQNGGFDNRDICAEKAWDITRGTATVVVAIIDDGFQLDHPDLAANIYTNTAEGSPGIDGDVNTYTNDVHGWDFADKDNDPSPVFSDDNHGTAMAGIIAAVADGSVGIAGVANRCRILPVRVAMLMSESEWVEAVAYAASIADVISISLYLDPSDAIRDAFSSALIEGRGGKGCVICTALGDDGILRRYSSDTASSPQVITVSSTSNFDKRSYFADYGPSLCLVCPSGGGSSAIYTTDRTGANGYNAGSDYTYISGASASCPIVAGVAALMVAANPAWTGLEVRQMLEATCDRIDSTANTYGTRGWNRQYGHGRVNAWAALTDARAAWDPYEPDDLAAQAVDIEDDELQYKSLGSSADVDWVRLAVASSASNRLTVLGTTNVFLRLYDVHTNEITAVERSSSFPELTAALTNGTYYVRVQSTNGVAVLHYGLHRGVLNMKDAYEPDDTTNNAGVIQPRTMQYRTLYPVGDVDWAYFNLATNALVNISTMGEWDGWLDAALYRGDGTLLTNCWESAYNSIGVNISTQLAAGKYYVRVTDHEGWALTSYQLLLETCELDSAEPDGLTNQASTVTSGQRLSRTLWPTNDVDWFSFVVSNPSAVLIMTDTINPQLSATNGKVVPTLYNGTGTAMTVYGGDNGRSFKAIHWPLLDPGTYYIKVAGSTGTVTCADYYLALDLFEYLHGGFTSDSFTATTNGFMLEWDGDAAFSYQIRYGSNLASTQAWTTATNLEGRIGRNSWTDDGTVTVPAPGAVMRRFYRVDAQ